MSKSPGEHKGKTKSKKKTRKSTKPKADEKFMVIADYRIGEAVPDQPPLFASEFRLLRHMLRWAKRYGVLRDGRLLIFESRQLMEKNRPWRSVDLTRSVVAYRDSDNKISINTMDHPAEIFRLKIDDNAKFNEWVRKLRLHRQYRQAKLTPIPKIATVVCRATGRPPTPPPRPPPVPVPPPPLPPPPVPPPPVPSADQKYVAEHVHALEQLLEKLEAAIPPVANHTDDTTQQLQKEYLTAAKEAQEKFRALFNLSGAQSHLKWQPTKPKISRPTTPPPPPPDGHEKSKRAPAAHKPAAKVSPAVKEVPTVTVTEPPATPEPEWAPAPPPFYMPPIPSPVTPVSSAVPSAQDSGQSGNITPPSAELEEMSAIDEPQDNVPDAEGEKSLSEKDEKEPVPSGKVPIYRDKLPAPMGPQPSIFKLAMSAIGRDIMQFSLPAGMMQPLSFTQVMCEDLEYSELIDLAVSTSEAHMRMVYVAAFAVSRYGSTAYRVGRKPFNPLLGQTFEFHSPHLGWKFIAEQVQHRPPLTAGYAESRGWRWWHDCEIVTTFGGNSMDVRPVGTVYLHLEKWDETYSWNKVNTTISGLLKGAFSLDHYGDMVVKCPKTEMIATVHFMKRTNTSRGAVEGKVTGPNGRVMETIYGNWCDSLYSGEVDDTTAHCIWRLAALPQDYAKYYGYTRFAMALNEIRPEIHGLLPKTDSRYRPDQKALEMGKPDQADKIKKDLEDRQRKRRKDVEAGKRGKPTPLWFKATGNTNPMKGPKWQFNGTYWKAKEDSFKRVYFLPLW